MQEPARVRIEELRLVGFRAFEDARLSLDEMTVLVGRNGAGKSTLLDAFEFLREALTDSLENALERRGGIQAVLHRGPMKKKRLAVAVKMRFQPGFFARFPRDPDGEGSFSSTKDTTIVYGFSVQARRGGAGYFVEDEGLSTLPGAVRTFMYDTQGRSTSLKFPGAPQNAQEEVILEAIRQSFRTYKLSPSTIRAEPPVGPASILQRDGGNLGDVLKHVEKNRDDLAWIVRHLAAITPGIVGVQSGTAAGRRLVRFLQESGSSKTRFDVGDMSDGTLRCLAILLALRQRPTPAVVSIDEIEDSVHPAALAVLLDAVSASTERCQVLLTSHSPEALSHPAVTADRVRVIEWRDGKSEVFRLSPGAEEMSRPPRSVGKLLRTNALFTADSSERMGDDLFGHE